MAVEKKIISLVNGHLHTGLASFGLSIGMKCKANFKTEAQFRSFIDNGTLVENVGQSTAYLNVQPAVLPESMKTEPVKVEEIDVVPDPVVIDDGSEKDPENLNEDEGGDEDENEEEVEVEGEDEKEPIRRRGKKATKKKVKKKKTKKKAKKTPQRLVCSDCGEDTVEIKSDKEGQHKFQCPICESIQYLP